MQVLKKCFLIFTGILVVLFFAACGNNPSSTNNTNNNNNNNNNNPVTPPTTINTVTDAEARGLISTTSTSLDELVDKLNDKTSETNNYFTINSIGNIIGGILDKSQFIKYISNVFDEDLLESEIVYNNSLQSQKFFAKLTIDSNNKNLDLNVMRCDKENQLINLLGYNITFDNDSISSIKFKFVNVSENGKISSIMGLKYDLTAECVDFYYGVPKTNLTSLEYLNLENEEKLWSAYMVAKVNLSEEQISQNRTIAEFNVITTNNQKPSKSFIDLIQEADLISTPLIWVEFTLDNTTKRENAKLFTNIDNENIKYNLQENLFVKL